MKPYLSWKSKSGTILPTIMIISAVGALAAGTVMTISLQKYWLVDRTLKWEQALAIAEGGAELVVSKIGYANASGGLSPTAGNGAINGSTYSYSLSGDRIECSASVGDVTRTVKVYGIAPGYWCKWGYFAEYFNIPRSDGTPGSKIWLITGDYIEGDVHCNHDIYISGNPIFDSPVSLSGNMNYMNNSQNNPQFNGGGPNSVNPIDLYSIDFAQMKANATSQGWVLTGETDITVNGNQATIVNQSTTNTYTIADGQNVLYVETGSVPDEGAGSWQPTTVTNETMVWTPSGYSVVSNSGHYATGVAAGNQLYTAQFSGRFRSRWGGYYYRTCKWSGKSSWGNLKYRYWRGWSWSGQYWRHTQRSVSVPAHVYSDRVETARTDIEGKVSSSDSYHLGWIGAYNVSNWVEGSVVTNVVTSNLVAVVTNYQEYAWVPDTNAVLTGIGDVTISGMLSEGFTIISDRDITVVDDLVYTNEYGTGYAYTNPASDVMCALISGGDVVVANENPSQQNDDRTIHASIMALGTQTGTDEGDPNQIDGRFVVDNYNQGRYKGTLHVYGGIVQNWRGPVGTFGGGGPRSGFTKDYQFDIRYGAQHGKAPPGCPLIDVQFTFDRWEETN